MAKLNITDVQHTERGSIREYLREINVRLRQIGNIVSFNDGDRWDDLRFPASGINPAGPVSAPAEDTTNGGFLFSPSATNTIVFQVQMPHSWKEGSAISPHLHWQKTSGFDFGNVLWRLEWKHAPIGSAMDALFSSADVTVTVPGTPDNGVQDEHLISSFGDSAIDMSDKLISHMMLCRLSRIGGDPLDTYGANARLIEFDIHYQLDSRGSLLLFEKDA